MGPEDYTFTAQANGHPAAGLAVQLAAGADALKTAAPCAQKVAELSRDHALRFHRRLSARQQLLRENLDPRGDRNW
jgi:multidrug efflux pump subunit AcrB